MVDFISFTPTQLIDRQRVNTLVNDLNSKNKIEFFKKAEVLLSVINIKNIFIDHFNNDKKTQEITNKESKFVLSEQDTINNIKKNKALADIDETISIFDKVSRAMPSDASEDDYPIDSLSDLFNDIKQSIVAGKNDYLDVLKDIFSKYMDFVNALREALSKLSEYTEAGGKDGYINVDLTKFFGELDKIVNDFSNSELTGYTFFEFKMPYLQDEDGRYYRMVGNEKIYYGSFYDLDNARAKIADLFKGIKGIVFSESSSKDPSTGEEYFKIEAGIDLSAIENFLKSLKKNGLGKKDMLQTEFDLLKKALDALEKKINTNLDELSKKYSSANSNYDNFVKIVSSTMNTLLEMAKGFLRL
ncbi:MAG: IpaD/SipD/SspD family type III secretion system needle tip protein [Proteus mirabilis]|nr:IpaD/SipD/SspD family type III secretion system needle tip protein [Proteus mirabilis]